MVLFSLFGFCYKSLIDIQQECNLLTVKPEIIRKMSSQFTNNANRKKTQQIWHWKSLNVILIPQACLLDADFVISLCFQHKIHGLQAQILTIKPEKSHKQINDSFHSISSLNWLQHETTTFGKLETAFNQSEPTPLRQINFLPTC